MKKGRPKLMPFTVVGYHADTYGIFCDHVKAKNPYHAFGVSAAQHPNSNISYVCALPGCFMERDDTIVFPGECVVDSTVILDPNMKGVFE